VFPASPRRGYRATPSVGDNAGLPAVYAAQSRVVLRHALLRGYDNPSSTNGRGYGGDALQVAGSGTAVQIQRDQGAPNLLRAGSGLTFGGSCVHAIGPSILPVLVCGETALQPGPGAMQRGGVYSWNNDLGLVAPGVERILPACLFEAAGSLTASAETARQGSIFTLSVASPFPRAFGAFLSPSTVWLRYPGAEGIGILDYWSPATLHAGSGLVPPSGTASLSFIVPTSSTLVGLQLSAQALLGATSLGYPALSFSHGCSFVIE
jgi:hypothetical protein